MTTLSLPRPYPDELIGSVITRAAIHNALGGKKAVRILRDDQPGGISFFLPSNLADLARRMRLEPRSLLWEHTVFPYAVAYKSAAEVAQLEAAVLEPQTSAAEAKRLNQAGTEGFSALRYCLKCAEEDLHALGESYWRVSHNLPVVHVCLKHDTVLQESPLTPRSSSQIFGQGLPHHQPGGGSSATSAGNLKPEVRLALSRASQICQERRNAHAADWFARHKALAYEKGFLKQGQIATTQLSMDLAAFYGEAYLEGIGSPVVGTVGSWPARLVRLASSPLISPVKHTLLRTFLELSPAGLKPLSYPEKTLGRHRLISDEDFAAKVLEASACVNALKLRISPSALLRALGYWTIYYRNPERYPLARAAVQEFRMTPASAHKPAYVPR
jgi:hypothetical protein